MGLQEHRSEIERIDEQIIRLINKRIGISKGSLRLKGRKESQSAILSVRRWS